MWTDLTVQDAAALTGFYENVVGWKAAEHPVGDYSDYDMKDAKGEVVAGICYARGTNANVPNVWLIYIPVDDVDAAANAALAAGGKVIDGPRRMGSGQFAVIEDPQGAKFAVFASLKKD
ncbi:MAG TPA: VOC family protein [Chlorobiota bacterium]|nr:VOC family protein [Chlorobiota bacterium]